MVGIKVYLVAQFLRCHVVRHIDDGVLERGFAAYRQCCMVFVRFNSSTYLVDQLIVCVCVSQCVCMRTEC